PGIRNRRLVSSGVACIRCSEKHKSCWFFFSSRRRHTRCYRDWSSDVCSSDLRSGGIAMMAGVFSGFAILQTPLVVVLPAAALVAVSHLDDAFGLPIPVRLGAQFAAAAAFALGAIPAAGLPSLIPIVIGILWMTNL